MAMRKALLAPALYSALAAGALAIHLAYIAWVIFGALFTRRRVWLAAFHSATLIYGILVEALDWWCPLTAAENWLEARAGVMPYRGPFLLHSLDLIVYPHAPPNLILACGVAVCLFNLGIYARRWHRRQALGSS